MAIKIQQRRKIGVDTYEEMYPKTQADCVSVNGATDLQTKLDELVLSDKENAKQGVYTFTCTYDTANHIFKLSGTLPADTALVSGIFKAPKDYTDGDTFQVGSTSYTIQTLDGKALTAGAFKSGSVVPIVLDTGNKKINFKMGGSRQAGTRLITEIYTGNITGSTKTWTCPEGVSQVRVRLFGAGGKGGNQNFSGGGGGGHMRFGTLEVEANKAYTITFGASNDRNGGATDFGKMTSASGGASGTVLSDITLNNGYERSVPGCGGSGGGAGVSDYSGFDLNFYGGGFASYGGGGGGAHSGGSTEYGSGGNGGKYGGGGGAGGNTSGSYSEYNQYIDGISFVGKTINGTVNTETKDPESGETTFRKGLGGQGHGNDSTTQSAKNGVNTVSNDYGIGPLDFTGVGTAGTTASYNSSSHLGYGYGGGGGFGGKGGNGGSGGSSNGSACGGGGGGGGFGGNGGNGSEYAGGGGGGFGADGGNAGTYCGGGGGGYGPFGKGGDGEQIVSNGSLGTTYLVNTDGGIAAGGGAAKNGMPGKGGPGICIIQYYL